MSSLFEKISASREGGEEPEIILRCLSQPALVDFAVDGFEGRKKNAKFNFLVFFSSQLERHVKRSGNFCRARNERISLKESFLLRLFSAFFFFLSPTSLFAEK